MRIRKAARQLPSGSVISLTANPARGRRRGKTVYMYQIRPVVLRGGEAMDRIFPEG